MKCIPQDYETTILDGCSSLWCAVGYTRNTKDLQKPHKLHPLSKSLPIVGKFWVA